MTGTDNARGHEDPGTELSEEYTDLVAFLLTSARGLYGEPHSYGPMRVVDALGMVHALCTKLGVPEGELNDIVDFIEEKRWMAFTDPDRFAGVLDEAIMMLADYTARK